MLPRVSVCLPVYNAGQFITEALSSVLDQSFTDLEVVVCDNRSTDGSREIIERFAASDRRIRYLPNDQNIGMVNNWNRCLREARGEYVKFLFGDDRLVSSKAIRNMIEPLDRDPSVVLVATGRQVIDQASRVLRTVSRYGDRTMVLPGALVVRDCLLEQRNLIGEPSSVLFRREQGKRGFDGRYRQFVDLEMWVHLLLQGSFAYLPEPLCAFRVHDRQATAQNLSTNVHLDEQALLAAEHAGHPSLRFSSLERAYMRFIPAVVAWRLYRRHGRLSREAALAKIRDLSGRSGRSFLLFYPVYRVYRLYAAIARRVKIWAARRPIQ